MTEFVGVQRRALVDALVERLDALCAGESVPAVVVLEAELGAGKSRIVREFYERLRQREAEGGPQYWPPLEEPRRQMPVKADPLPMRKVIGPPLNGFRWAPNAVPAFGWWDLACQQLRSGEMTAVTRDFEEWQRVHGPAMWWAWNTRAGNWEKVRSKHDEIVSQALDALAEGQMHALEQMAEAFDLPSIGLGWAIARAWDMWEYAGVRKQRREALAGDVTFDADPTTRSLEIASLLRQTARPDLPLVLAIEDAHEMGEDLAALIGALAQPSPDHPVLVIATAWPEGRTKETWNLWLTTAAAQQRAEAWSVAPLTTYERLEIVQAYAPSTESELAEAVAQRWEQPLALELLLTWERLALHIAENNGALQYSAQELADFPTEIQSLFERRWQDLPPALKTALAVARIGLPEEAGTEPFIASLVAEAAQQLDRELEAESVLAQFDQAREFRWIADSPSGDAFVETTLATVVWDDLANVLGRDWRKSWLPGMRDGLIRGLAARINGLRGDGYLLVESSFAPVATASEVNTMASWLFRLLGTDDGHASESVAAAKAVSAIHLAVTAAGNFKFARALDLGSQGLLKLPLDHPDTLTTRGKVAAWQAETGNWVGALRSFRELLSDQAKVFGPDHPDVLMTRNNVANCLAETGSVVEAVGTFRELLDDQKRTLGPDHPNTLITRNNLASWLADSGHPDEALAEQSALLGDATRILGLDHPNTLIIRNNLANALADAGQLAEALTELRAIFDDQSRTLGPDHPNTLTTRGNLASCLAKSGQLADAISELRANFDDQARILGPHHPNTLATRHLLAYRLAESGQISEAMTAFHRLLDDQNRILGPSHTDTLATRNSLANWLAASGRIDEAILQFNALLEDATRILGTDHPNTYSIRSNLAGWHASAGHLEASLSVYETLLATPSQAPNHPDTLTTLNGYALSLAQAGRLDEAMATFSALLEDANRILGADHPDTLRFRGNFINWRAQSQRDDAMCTQFNELLDDQIRILGADHLETLLTRFNHAKWHAGCNGHEVAVSELRALLDDQSRILGPDHPYARTTRDLLEDLQDELKNPYGANR